MHFLRVEGLGKGNKLKSVEIEMQYKGNLRYLLGFPLKFKLLIVIRYSLSYCSQIVSLICQLMISFLHGANVIQISGSHSFKMKLKDKKWLLRIIYIKYTILSPHTGLVHAWLIRLHIFHTRNFQKFWFI